MKTFEEDKELRQLLKSIKLEKPAPDFTKVVMNRVFQERTIVEQVRVEPVLGKGFWIILALFVLLMAVMVLLSGSNIVPESTAVLPEINTEKYMSGYRSFFENFGNLPVSIAGITLAFSMLIFLERFLSSRRPELT